MKILDKRILFIISCIIFVLILTFPCLETLYIYHKDFFGWILGIFVFIAAAIAALANWKMMEANREMAATSREEIKILTSYHDYAIAPIIVFEFIDGRFCLNRPLKINNATENTALKVTVFARLSGKEYISSNIGLLVKNSKSVILMNDCSSIMAKFMEIYEQELVLNKNLKDSFCKFFDTNNNCFFVAYVNIEGKIHGTALKCDYITTFIDKVKIFPPKPEDFEEKRHNIPYYAVEQQFYILNDAITQGIGIALTPPKNQ